MNYNSPGNLSSVCALWSKVERLAAELSLVDVDAAVRVEAALGRVVGAAVAAAAAAAVVRAPSSLSTVLDVGNLLVDVFVVARAAAFRVLRVVPGQVGAAESRVKEGIL